MTTSNENQLDSSDNQVVDDSKLKENWNSIVNDYKRYHKGGSGRESGGEFDEEIDDLETNSRKKQKNRDTMEVIEKAKHDEQIEQTEQTERKDRSDEIEQQGKIEHSPGQHSLEPENTESQPKSQHSNIKSDQLDPTDDGPDLTNQTDPIDRPDPTDLPHLPHQPDISLNNLDSNTKNLVMAWYWAGYYHGLAARPDK